jgi:hypothetical protein
MRSSCGPDLSALPRKGPCVTVRLCALCRCICELLHFAATPHGYDGVHPIPSYSDLGGIRPDGTRRPFVFEDDCLVLPSEEQLLAVGYPTGFRGWLIGMLACKREERPSLRTAQSNFARLCQQEPVSFRVFNSLSICVPRLLRVMCDMHLNVVVRWDVLSCRSSCTSVSFPGGSYGVC